ncbi:MAG: efflux RND transporter periplasmic adaptor subunit [Capsulimonadaceae bacterium]
MSTTDRPDSVREPGRNGSDGKRSADPGLRPLAGLVIGLVVVFGAVLVIGLMPRLARGPIIEADARAQTAPPIVNAALVQAAPAFDNLDLPGNIDAVQQTAVVARASGYVKQYLVDIGDRVRAGQTLAIIDSPDLDQQVTQARAQLGASQAAYYQAKAFQSNQEAGLAQARAALSRSHSALEQARTQLAQAQAALAQSQQQLAQQQSQLDQGQTNLNLAKVTATRYQNLLADGAIDRQTTDQMVAAYQSSQANVQALQSAMRAGQANVQAFRAAVQSGRANVQAFADDIRSSQAAVDAAAANVQSAGADVQAAADNVQSSQANLSREVVLQQFESVTAPFPGVITARNGDDGALISAAGGPVGSSEAIGGGMGTAASGSAGSAGGGSASSLFSLAELDRVRVYISVPQSYSGVVRVGQKATVTVSEFPHRTFISTITRTAGAFDPASRTLVTEVRLNNPDGLLRPGMFATVHLRLQHPGDDVLIPDSALVTNAQGNQAVVIDPDNTIHYRPISVGRDFGQVIEVTSGLHTGEQIAASPSDSLVDGEKVQSGVSAPAAH